MRICLFPGGAIDITLLYWEIQFLRLRLYKVIQMNFSQDNLFAIRKVSKICLHKIAKEYWYPKFFISILGERIQIASDGSCEECGILWNDTQSRS